MITDPHKTTYLTIENKKVPVWIYGDEKNLLVFFIHGYFRGFSDYVGDLPMRHMMKNYCVVAFDLPGFGLSWDLKMDRTNFVQEVISKIAKDKPYFVFGLSYGGLMGLKYALTNPPKLKGLIIGGMPYFAGFMGLIHLVHILPFLRKLRISGVIKEFSFLNRKNLTQVNVPVLLLYSSKDSQATEMMGRQIENMLPNSKLFLINKYDHSWLMHDIADSGFLKEIKEFIKNYS